MARALSKLSRVSARRVRLLSINFFRSWHWNKRKKRPKYIFINREWAKKMPKYNFTNRYLFIVYRAYVCATVVL
jgi:hypothetical protein